MSDLMGMFHKKPTNPDAASPEYIDEMPDAAATVKHAIAFSKKFPDTPPDGCYRCEQELYISFFFDGFGHDQKVDAQKGTLSNIGRLFAAHKDDEKKGTYRRYYEGLGTRLSNAPVTAHDVLAPAENDAESIATGKAQGVVSDPYKKPLSAMAKAKWDNPNATMRELATEGQNVAAEQVDREKVWAKITDWKGAVKAKWAGVGFMLIAENVAAIRDSEKGAALLGTGVAKRVDKAVKDFEKIVKDAAKDPRALKRIKIAVFGYDRGALVARTFASQLFGKECKLVKGETQFQGIPVECDFMGLFDSVSASYADTLFIKAITTAIGMVPTGGITRPVVRYLADGALQLVSLIKRRLEAVEIPDQVKRVMHYLAANELRFYKRVDSLRKSQAKDRITEVVFPGTQPDIGGGARNGDGGKSNELAKLVARCMHREAWSSGVPMQRLDQLAANYPAVLREFRSKTPLSVNGATYTVDDLFQAYLRHVHASGPLEKHFMAHQKVFVSYLRRVNDRLGKTDGTHFSNRAAFEYQALIDNSSGSFSPELGVDVAMPGTSATDIADPDAKELGLTWENPQSLPPLVIAFFDHVFHNTMTEPLNDAALNAVSYFMLRPIEDGLPAPVAPLPDPIPGAGVL